MILVFYFYSACKNTVIKPAAATPETDAIGAAIASNMVQSLSGMYGGASIRDGIGKSAFIAAASPQIKLQSILQCGFFIDTSLNVNFNQGDSIKTHTTGSVNYFFNCDSTAEKPTGYNLSDSLTSAGKGHGYDFNFLVSQHYSVSTSKEGNSGYTLNGALKSWVDFDYNLKPDKSSAVHNIFHFTNMKIQVAGNFEIVSGEATFESKGVTAGGAWNFSGYIRFIGNNKAKLTLLNKVYLINLFTGSLTKV
ncbi:hypothetical protein MuYL_3819 [Mucilaginibacter xinganensis]|uniref:Uncharacterized protein n=2 Tax=Mucilaginibacter xinganensis TaxID=1234841 RepID=A0A223P1A0_9SPHI|nr:hypothetical protein MuYL_3819 [Mucilaginibacter xinganensis]